MLTDEQYRKLGRLRKAGHTIAIAAAKAGMDEKTAASISRWENPPAN